MKIIIISVLIILALLLLFYNISKLNHVNVIKEKGNKVVLTRFSDNNINYKLKENNYSFVFKATVNSLGDRTLLVETKNWYLDISGDDKALPAILKRIGSNSINLIHYDSDKSYSARNNALKILDPNINSETIIIFDDIQDNLHFKDLIKNSKDNETAKKNLLSKKWKIKKTSKFVTIVEKKKKYVILFVIRKSSVSNFRFKTSKTNCIWN